MASLAHLRIAAREMFDEALKAVDPGQAVRRAVHCDEQVLTICNLEINLQARKVYSIAIGKAAAAMALALEDKLGDLFSHGVIAGPTPAQPNDDVAVSRRELSTRWRRFEGGHPLPNEESLSAASEAFGLLDRANRESSLIIFLISGGGSAMMEWPISEEISLADLRRANETLVNCGGSIAEINAVRRTFSAVKGGKLADRAPNCDQITLIVSDVREDQEWDVASGPTLAPPPDAPNARDVIVLYHLSSQLPALLAAVKQSSQPKEAQKGLRAHRVLLSNRDALRAAEQAAQQRGFMAEIAVDISDQSIEDGAELLLKRIDRLRRSNREKGKVFCSISGGEFALHPRGNGIGGRNLETALRMALSGSSSDTNDLVALCAGTDGVDGNSPAAGAIVDSKTMLRAQALGLDADDFLRRSDSYSFFVALGDVITTGPTGTNVRDIRILLAEG